ncbi:dynactin light chain p62 subunit [Phytophthora cinnamomi]|uniref:dynactin light chain p62 subunit n=1 Tax=Phytophthora cinnamomi TaxID=4785 RepID=UPI00355A1AE7|nr:dynactin light chain p62 subunit [Phytophthora cinnamomi]
MQGDAVDGVRVRYACKCGHLAPVSALFFSETSEKLVCRLPGCSVEEFESYYCGNLLVNLPSKEASMYQNRSSRCFSCPACETALSTAFHESKQRFFFLCAHCRWDSLELGLADDDPDALVMTAITRERQAAHEDVFQALHSHYSTLSSSSSGGNTLASASGAAFGRSSSLQLLADSMKELQREHQMKKFRLQRMAEMGGWKYDQALAKVQEKEQWLLEQRREHQWPELQKQLSALQTQGTSWGDDTPEKTRETLEKLAQKSEMGEVSTLHQRLLNPLDQSREADRLFPSRPLLRVKRTWRCVESIERGTAGILVKPQISPMSGDSSLPVSASWFKKANLAAQYVPVVTFQRLPYRAEAGGDVDCILLVENPLDDAIRITFRSAPATETGEESTENGQVVLQDLTPIVVGPYEDPNLADAFIDDEPPFGANGDDHNTMLLQATRNLIKIKLTLTVNPIAPPSTSSISARFIMDTEKFDEDANEVIENSLQSVPVVITAPMPQ